VISAGALLLITIVAILFAIQEHNDRVLSKEMTEAASELQDTGERITSIRDADMKDMNDASETRNSSGDFTPDLISQIGQACRTFWISRGIWAK
jgi:hypothetical protein